MESDSHPFTVFGDRTQGLTQRVSLKRVTLKLHLEVQQILLSDPPNFDRRFLGEIRNSSLNAPKMRTGDANPVSQDEVGSP